MQAQRWHAFAGSPRLTCTREAITFPVVQLGAYGGHCIHLHVPAIQLDCLTEIVHPAAVRRLEAGLDASYAAGALELFPGDSPLFRDNDGAAGRVGVGGQLWRGWQAGGRRSSFTVVKSNLWTLSGDTCHTVGHCGPVLKTTECVASALLTLMPRYGRDVDTDVLRSDSVPPLVQRARGLRRWRRRRVRASLQRPTPAVRAAAAAVALLPAAAALAAEAVRSSVAKAPGRCAGQARLVLLIEYFVGERV